MPFRPLQDMDLSLGNLQDEMNQLVRRMWHAGLSTGPLDGQQWAPMIDLYEHTDHYTLFAELAGVDTSLIEVTHVGHTLTIRGEKTKSSAISDSDRAVRRERRFGTFCRSIEMPGDCDVERLSARSTAGVLEITIPKSEASKPRAVKIQVDEG